MFNKYIFHSFIYFCKYSSNFLKSYKSFVTYYNIIFISINYIMCLRSLSGFFIDFESPNVDISIIEYIGLFFYIILLYSDITFCFLLTFFINILLKPFVFSVYTLYLSIPDYYLSFYINYFSCFCFLIKPSYNLFGLV